MAEDSISTELPKEILLVIFVHGFKGTDTTFGDFPNRLQHNLSQIHLDMQVECLVFPAYETKGELHAAVERFADWLVTLTVDRESASGTGRGAGSARLVLCGHSMGGLLIADTLIAMHKSRPDPKAPLWPRIIALVAFDTPYYGLNPGLFKNKVTEGIGYVDQASKVASSLWSISNKFGGKGAATSSSGAPALALAAPPAVPASVWSKWAPAAYGVGGALLAGATAGTAYWKRDEITLSYTWLTDHMRYVGSLWETENLKARVDKVVDIATEQDIEFATFYTILPAKPPAHPAQRAFILLPRPPEETAQYFLPNKNEKAEDEISAHTGMFDAKTSDGFWDLGLATGRVIRTAVAKHEAIDVDNGIINHEPSSGDSAPPEESKDPKQEPLIDLGG